MGLVGTSSTLYCESNGVGSDTIVRTLRGNLHGWHVTYIRAGCGALGFVLAFWGVAWNRFTYEPELEAISSNVRIALVRQEHHVVSGLDGASAEES